MQIGLKRQLLISMAAALFLPLIVSTVFFNHSIRALIDSRLAQIELPSALREVRNGVELDLQAAIVASRGIALNAYVHDFLVSGDDVAPQASADADAEAGTEATDEVASNPLRVQLDPAEAEALQQAQQAQLVRYLNGVKASNGAIAAYVVSGQTGNYFNTDGLFKTLSPAAERDQWFYAFLKSGESYELSLDIDEASGQPTVFINYKIDADGVRGVGGIGQSLAAMSNLIRTYKLGNSGQIYLVDQSGRIKLHRDVNESGQNIAQRMQTSTTALLQSTDVVSLPFKRDGKDYLAASIPLESADWYLVAEIPREELYAGLDSTIISNIIISLAVAGLFFAIVLWLSNRIVKPVQDITNAIEDITQRGGDLTARLPEARGDELGELARQVNIFISQLQDLCRSIVDSSHAVAKASSSVNEYVQQAATRTEQQQLNTDMVASAVNEMGATVNEVARNAADAADASRDAHQAAAEGQTTLAGTVQDMDQLTDAMQQSVLRVEQLAQDIKSITGLLDVITGISEQTNLLALNAAIEAARAGEQGRGFAVVADEVRTLAQRTAKSTEEISEMIVRLDRSARSTVESIQAGSQRTSQSVLQVQETGGMLGTITERVNRISDMNYQIATATEEQSLATEEINRNVQSITDHSRRTGEDIAQCKKLCQELNTHSVGLAELMRRFTL